MTIPSAVLFDFDGVIADTANVHVAAWERVLGRMALELPDHEAARAAEIDDRAFLVEVFESRKIEGADLDGWLALKRELTASLLADAPRIYPGALELIDDLKARGVRLAIVTTTTRRNVEIVLDSVNRADAFEFIVGREDVAAPKPAPDGYALAVKRLGLASEAVVAIEDSPTGVQSARAAGVGLLAVGHRFRAGDWTQGAPFVAALANRAATRAALGL